MRYIWWLISLFAWGTAAQSLPAERIFLALEKESCMPGDTLFVNGQLLAADSRAHSPHSRYVYVECVNDRDSLLLRQKAACDAKGYFALEIPTQVNWLSNLCYLRAYTRLMQNYETESFTVAPFFLGAVHPAKARTARLVDMRCFPEGGTLLEGYLQNMVFHLSDEDGFPVVPQRMRLLDTANDTILRQIAVSENGLGRCTFQPEAGKSYRLQAEYDGRFINFPLKTEASGTALQAAVSRDRLSCRIFSSDEKEVRLFLYQAETGLTEIPLPDGKRAAVLDLSDYPRGVYTLFLTDADFRLLNERSLWLPPTEQPDFSFQLPQTVFSPSAPLDYRLQAPDSSRVFTRIVAEDDLIAAQAYPSLSFGNEVVSPVRFPLIDNRGGAEQQEEINNWLFTARFALFPVAEVLKAGMQYPYPIEDVMLLAGTAWKSENQPLEAGMLINAHNMKEQLLYAGATDEKGGFVIPVEDYPTGTWFRFSARDKKGKTVEASITLAEEHYPEVRIPYPVFTQTPLQADVLPGDSSSFRYGVDEDQNKVYYIDSVTVKARRKVDYREAARSPLNFIGEVELQKRASLNLRSVLNMFPSITVQKSSSGGGEGVLGTLNKSLRFAQGERERSLSEPSQDSGELGIFWRNNRDPRTGGTSFNKLAVVVDGEVAFGDIGYILDMPAGSIKSVELLKASDVRCARYNATSGALVIETRQGIMPSSSELPGTTLKPFGLSVTSRPPVVERQAPSQPGRYRLLVDVITSEQQVASFCQPFEVK